MAPDKREKKKLVASKPEVPSPLKNHCVNLKPLKIILFFLKIGFFHLQKIDTTQYNFFLRKNRTLLFKLSLSAFFYITFPCQQIWELLVPIPSFENFIYHRKNRESFLKNFDL